MRDDEDAGGRAPQQDSATRAFEALRAEVTVLRRAVEELPEALQGQRPPDYTSHARHDRQGAGGREQTA